MKGPKGLEGVKRDPCPPEGVHMGVKYDTLQLLSFNIVMHFLKKANLKLFMLNFDLIGPYGTHHVISCSFILR